MHELAEVYKTRLLLESRATFVDLENIGDRPAATSRATAEQAIPVGGPRAAYLTAHTMTCKDPK